MFRTTLKNLAARRLRLALTAVSVVLGVGFIAGTFVLTDTMNHAFNELFTEGTSGVDVYVRASDLSTNNSGSESPTVPESLLPDVRRVAGVDKAVGSVGGYAQFIDKDGDPIGVSGGAPTLGTSWRKGQSSGLTIRDGRPPASDGEVVMDAQTAETHSFALGDRIKILLEGPVREFEIVGIAGFGDADNMGGAMAVFDITTAQKVFNKPDSLDSIEVTAEEGLSAAKLVDGLGEALPEGYNATSGADAAAEQAASIKDQLGFFTTALLVFAAIAVLVGAFTIFNTFSIVVAQRTREFALLKSLGASGRQVLTTVLVEAGVVGLIASIVGLGAGVGIAAGLKSLLSAFGVDLPSTDLQFLPRTVIVSLVVGILVTVVASVIPARKAAKVSPMAALRATASGPSRWSKKRTIVGTALMVLGGVTLLSGKLSDGNAASAVGLGALAIFFGVTVLTPLFAGSLARWIGGPFARFFGMPAKLAQENAARNPKRTAATASALMIGLALVSLVSILGSSIKATSARVLDESVEADFMVKSGGAMMMGPGFPHSVAEEIASLDGVAGIATLAHGEFKAAGKATEVAAIDPRSFERVVDLEIVSGELAALGSGNVLVEEATAEARSLEVGDTLPVEFARTGEKRLEVVGVFKDKGIVGSGYAISNQAYMRNFRAHLVEMAMVQLSPEANAAEVRNALEAATADYPNVEVQDQEAFVQEQAAHIDELFALVTALLGLALLIALFGITNTLALSVYERVREIGLLRAVGMLRRQTKAALRWEAFIVSIIGALLGVAVGVFFGWSIVTSLESEGISQFAVPGSSLVIYLLIAGAAGVVAALPPARRAARLNVLEAIATE